MSQPLVTLHDGVQIPQLGFGVWQTPPGETKDAVLTALETGYRHVDTAMIYGNEVGVGAAVRASGIPREDLFVTTKLWNTDQGVDEALYAFDKSRRKLGLDYVDLYLIHWPAPTQDRFVDAWRGLERLKADGVVRSIGVSNFRPEDLQRLIDLGLSVPTINQVELHPEFTQVEMREYAAQHEIAVEAWSPLAQGSALANPAIATIAERVGATPAQVVLAWHLALGNVVIPKSVTPSRIRENFGALDVRLTADDAAAISALDSGRRIGPDPATLV